MIISDLSVLEVASSDANVEGGSDLQLNVAILEQTTISDIRNRGGFGAVSTKSIANIGQFNTKYTFIKR